MSPSSIVSSGNSSRTFLTMGIRVAKWNGSAIACASVSPLNVKKASRGVSPSLTIGENELLKESTASHSQSLRAYFGQLQRELGPMKSALHFSTITSILINNNKPVSSTLPFHPLEPMLLYPPAL